MLDRITREAGLTRVLKNNPEKRFQASSSLKLWKLGVRKLFVSYREIKRNQEEELL